MEKNQRGEKQPKDQKHRLVSTIQKTFSHLRKRNAFVKLLFYFNILVVRMACSTLE